MWNISHNTSSARLCTLFKAGTLPQVGDTSLLHRCYLVYQGEVLCTQQGGAVAVKGCLLLLLCLLCHLLLDSVTHALQAAHQLSGVLLLPYSFKINPLNTLLAQVVVTEVTGKPRKLV